MTLRDIALEYWMRQLGTFYSWGGDDPAGFDCSGLVIEGLKAVDLLPRKGDWTSRELAKKWPQTSEIRPGTLLFWKRGRSIGHVEIVAYVLTVGFGEWGKEKAREERIFTIGASGGTSKTRDDRIERIHSLLDAGRIAMPTTHQDLINVAVILATPPDAAAIKANAYIKLRPVVPGWVKALDPFA